MSDGGDEGLQCGLSIVIPTLNAAIALAANLAQFASAGAGGSIAEIIVSDGGSHDGSAAIAAAAGAVVVTGPAGRGGQLGRGAAAASGRWLLFIHADTLLDAGWEDAVRDAMARRGDGCAFAFAFALDDAAPAARLLERLVAWRCRLFALPYGDQGLLISRRLYDEVGGFAPLPLMEDVEFIRRIGARRLQILPVRAVTSAARYRRDGYLRRSVRNLLCLSLWLSGVSPHRIAKLYG